MCTELKFLTGHNHKCVWYKDQDHLFFSFCNAIHVVYTLFSFHVSIFLFLPYKWFAWTYFEISLHKMWLRNMINTKYWVNPNSNTELNCIFFPHFSRCFFPHVYLTFRYDRKALSVLFYIIYMVPPFDKYST